MTFRIWLVAHVRKYSESSLTRKEKETEMCHLWFTKKQFDGVTASSLGVLKNLP